MAKNQNTDNQSHRVDNSLTEKTTYYRGRSILADTATSLISCSGKNSSIILI